MSFYCINSRQAFQWHSWAHRCIRVLAECVAKRDQGTPSTSCELVHLVRSSCWSCLSKAFHATTKGWLKGKHTQKKILLQWESLENGFLANMEPYEMYGWIAGLFNPETLHQLQWDCPFLISDLSSYTSLNLGLKDFVLCQAMSHWKCCCLKWASD